MALFSSTLSALACCPGVTDVGDTLQEPANSPGVWASVDIHSTKVLSMISPSTSTDHTKLCIMLAPLPSHAATGQGATAAVGQEVHTAFHLTSRLVRRMGGRGRSAKPHKQPASGPRAGPSPGPCGPCQSCGSPAGAFWSPGPATP